MEQRRTIRSLGPRKTLTEMAYEQLRDHIIRGILKPGESLSTAMIAKTMQISPMPVRGALTRLQTERLVAILPQRGVVVSDITPEELQENSIVRTRLEGLGAYLACSHITDRDIEFLRRLIREMRESGRENRAARFKANEQFHDAIVRCSRNITLTRLVRELRHQNMRSHLITSYVPGYNIHRELEHDRIVQALETRKADLAEGAMRAHLIAAGGVLVEYLRTASASSCAPPKVVDVDVAALWPAEGRAKPT